MINVVTDKRFQYFNNRETKENATVAMKMCPELLSIKNSIDIILV